MKEEDCDDHHSIYDDRTQTCFDFDPRDVEMNFLPKFENRQLSEAICGRIDNCFDCQYRGKICGWNETVGSCDALELHHNYQYWYE
jgi:hypothetical protein